ncbi:MAG: ABC transporter ATP-binding protein [Clostridia bacterium]|nr:ABC transporter ATP-binding protein [Clostridia bacterium]
MKKLLKHMRGYEKECVLGPLFKLFEATLELLVPLVVAALIDKGIAGGDRPFVLRMALLLVLFGAVGLFFSAIAQFFAAKAAVGFVTRIRSVLFSHIQSLSYTENDTLGTSTLIARITGDTAQVQSGVNLFLRLLLRSPFVVFGATIMAFFVDVRSALWFAWVIPLLSVVVFGVMLVSMPLYKKVQQRLDRLLRATRENLSGTRVLRAFTEEDGEIRRFEERNDALTKEHVHVGKISALLNPVTYILINLAIIALIYTGALRVELGLLTQGEVIALYNYMSQILVELIKLANMIIQITKALASAKRIEAILETENSQKKGKETTPAEGSEAIRFEAVSFTYPGAKEPSLSDISFSVGRGETLGIIGGTGSGKSTLAQLIGGFYDATEGSVTVLGRDVKDYDASALCKFIGTVPQKSVLFRGSIRDNMQLGAKDATDEQIMEAISIAQAAEIVRDKGGLDYEISQGAKNLSGGQRQRLSIARALVLKPEILVFDDSSSALDFATEAALRRDLNKLPATTTKVIISQRAGTLTEADKILVLDDGRIVGIGTANELLGSCAVFREIYESQFGEKEGGKNEENQ